MFPFIIDVSLTRVGLKWTLRLLALIVGIVGVVAVIGIKPRVPVAPVTNPGRIIRQAPTGRANFKFFTSPLYTVVALTIMGQALGYYPVPLYIPSYASAVGLSSINGTLALAAFNLATVVGARISLQYNPFQAILNSLQYRPNSRRINLRHNGVLRDHDHICVRLRFGRLPNMGVRTQCSHNVHLCCHIWKYCKPFPSIRSPV